MGHKPQGARMGTVYGGTWPRQSLHHSGWTNQTCGSKPDAEDCGQDATVQQGQEKRQSAGSERGTSEKPDPSGLDRPS